MPTQCTPAELREGLAQFNNSQLWWHTMGNGGSGVPVIHSEGCAYLADQAGAHWLLVAVASHLAFYHHLTDHGILFWRFERNRAPKPGGVLTARRDEGEEELVRQEVPWTDFPLPDIDLWTVWEGGLWKLFLPSEY